MTPSHLNVYNIMYLSSLATWPDELQAVSMNKCLLFEWNQYLFGMVPDIWRIVGVNISVVFLWNQFRFGVYLESENVK